MPIPAPTTPPPAPERAATPKESLSEKWKREDRAIVFIWGCVLVLIAIWVFVTVGDPR